MKKLLSVLIGGCFIAVASTAGLASPEEDRVAFENYYFTKFPNTPKDDFVNGIYSIDEQSRDQWVDLEEFPPYEIAVDKGQELFEIPFANGKTYADCFENGGIGIRQNYPYFDLEQGMVITAELAINQCREANGEKPLKYKKGDIAAISAYMAYTSRGNTINVVIPDDPRALEAYEQGKQFYYTKRGQLNFACSDCHVGGSGGSVRTEMLSPALGHPSHFPVYRLKWGEIGTLHRRFGGCNSQVRAKSFKAQSAQYRNLEYFLTYMSNGLEFNGPGVRR